MKSARKWHLNDFYHSVCPTTEIYFSIQSEFGKKPFVKPEIGAAFHCLQKCCTEKPLLGWIERSEPSCHPCLCSIVIQGVQY